MKGECYGCPHNCEFCAASNVFGSGWTWLVRKPDGKLTVVSTVNHQLPQVDNLEPILVLDVWEHAYYLKYQNRRDEFIENWWHLVNWPQVLSNYQKTKET